MAWHVGWMMGQDLSAVTDWARMTNTQNSSHKTLRVFFNIDKVTLKVRTNTLLITKTLI